MRLEADRWFSAERKGIWVQQPVDDGELPDEPSKLPGNSPGGYFGTGTWYLARALRSAIDEGSTAALAPAATFKDGWKQQRVLDAARESASSGGAWQEV